MYKLLKKISFILMLPPLLLAIIVLFPFITLQCFVSNDNWEDFTSEFRAFINFLRFDVF